MSTFVRSAVAVLALAGAAVADTETQWDFSGDLSASFGSGAMDYLSDQTKAETQFGSPGDFGLPEIGDEKSQIMHFPKAIDSTYGYIVLPDAPPNGPEGAAYVNEYSLIFDLLVPQSTFDAQEWLPFHNTNAENANDAELYMQPDGAIGIDGIYDGQLKPDTWHRVAITYEIVGEGGPDVAVQLHRYIDGAPVGDPINVGEVDGRHSAYTNLDATPWMYILTEPAAYATSAYINSFYFTDRTLSADEVAALGCVSVDGATTPGECQGGGCYADFTGEGDLDLFDFLGFVNSFNAGEDKANCDAQGGLDLFDFLCYTNKFNAGC